MEGEDPIYQDLVLSEEEKTDLALKCIDLLLNRQEDDEEEERSVSANVLQYKLFV